MFITDISLIKYKGKMSVEGLMWEDRLASPLDIYPQYADAIDTVPDFIQSKNDILDLDQIYLYIHTDHGVSGLSGPISNSVAYIIAKQLKPILIGKDAFATELIWDQMYRRLIHGRQGEPIWAMSFIDCALWDYEAKKNNKRVWELANLKNKPKPLISAESFGIRPLDKLSKDILKFKNAPLMKLKATRDKVLDIVNTAHKTSPKTKFIVDFNEGLFPSDVEELSKKLIDLNVILLEQPLHANQDEILSSFDHSIDIGADESCHTSDDIIRLKEKYDCIIIKPGKCGGLTESLKLKKTAEENGLKIMVVCMFGSSLAVAPAFVIAQSGVDYVNIEVPKAMAKDRENSIVCKNHLVYPPKPELWG